MARPTESSNSGDLANLDFIIRTLYSTLSGPAGQKRDWDRFHSLFWPNAQLVLAVSRPNENPRIKMLDVEGYIRRTAPFFETEAFWEKETGRKSDVFGNIAHVLSSYASYQMENGEPFQRGSNSIQLLWDGARWWIVSVAWNTERE